MISKINCPVYISLTSIFNNQHSLQQTLQSIINQTRKPDKIFLYLSEDKSFFDNGFTNKKITNEKLKTLIVNNKIIEIIWGNDIGPYGKLLPLLKEKWNEDCIIITIDDDTIYHPNLINSLIDDYLTYKCVISYRGFTPLFDKLLNFEFSQCLKNKLQNLSLYNFSTGKGGILYKPEFFYNTKDLIFNYEIYSEFCKKQDDIWFYIVRVLNNVKCYLSTHKKWLVKDIPTNGLYRTFNSKNNENAVAFKTTIDKLKELDYEFPMSS